jgi:hypothetical protein
MALIARALEKPDEEAKYWKKADTLTRLLNEKMWSEADAMYFNIDRRTGQMVKIRTWTSRRGFKTGAGGRGRPLTGGAALMHPPPRGRVP